MPLSQNMSIAELARFRTRICERKAIHGNCELDERCPFSHCLSWHRRNPCEYAYRPNLCPNVVFLSEHGKMRVKNYCNRGRMCMFSHTKEEQMYHVLVYKTQLCREYPACSKHYCPFAHGLEELRNPETIDFQPVQGPEIMEHSRLSQSNDVFGENSIASCLEKYKKGNNSIKPTSKPNYQLSESYMNNKLNKPRVKSEKHRNTFGNEKSGKKISNAINSFNRTFNDKNVKNVGEIGTVSDDCNSPILNKSNVINSHNYSGCKEKEKQYWNDVLISPVTQSTVCETPSTVSGVVTGSSNCNEVCYNRNENSNIPIPPSPYDIMFQSFNNSLDFSSNNMYGNKIENRITSELEDLNMDDSYNIDCDLHGHDLNIGSTANYQSAILNNSEFHKWGVSNYVFDPLEKKNFSGESQIDYLNHNVPWNWTDNINDMKNFDQEHVDSKGIQKVEEKLLEFQNDLNCNSVDSAIGHIFKVLGNMKFDLDDGKNNSTKNSFSLPTGNPMGFHPALFDQNLKSVSDLDKTSELNELNVDVQFNSRNVQ